MTDRRRTLIKTTSCLILAYLFGFAGIIFFIVFFADIFTEPVTGWASFSILAAMASTVLFVTFGKWSNSLQKKWDDKQYRKWRG